MSLVASEFNKQPESDIRSLVKDQVSQSLSIQTDGQFEGTLEYVTECQACSYRSSISSASR